MSSESFVTAGVNMKGRRESVLSLQGEKRRREFVHSTEPQWQQLFVAAKFCLLQTFNLPKCHRAKHLWPLPWHLQPACIQWMFPTGINKGLYFWYCVSSSIHENQIYSIMNYIFFNILFRFHHKKCKCETMKPKIRLICRYNIWAHVPVLNIFKLDHLYAKKIRTHFIQKSSSVNQRWLE